MAKKSKARKLELTESSNLAVQKFEQEKIVKDD